MSRVYLSADLVDNQVITNATQQLRQTKYYEYYCQKKKG